MKKIVMGLGILLAVGLTFYLGYDAYSHYMVTQFYKCIDAGDMDKALECIEKMPNVNTLEMSLPLYCVFRTLTQGASTTGYPLYYAVSNNADISIIRALLEKGADPNRTDLGFVGHYPLRYVSTNPSRDIYERVMLLVDYGADANTGYLYIPSRFAEYCGETKESVFLTITYLWENGAEEWHHVDTRYECTVLHEAAEWMDIEYLRKFYNNEKRPMKDLLNVQDINGETPLFRAIRSGRFDNCKFLVDEGTDISIRNHEGKTASDVATELGYEICENSTEEFEDVQ